MVADKWYGKIVIWTKW